VRRFAALYDALDATTSTNAKVAAMQAWFAEAPPADWTTVRLDLWDVYRKRVRIRSLSLAAAGGGALFDQIVLASEERELPPARPGAQKK